MPFQDSCDLSIDVSYLFRLRKITNNVTKIKKAKPPTAIKPMVIGAIPGKLRCCTMMYLMGMFLNSKL